jgi:hypothetical protein
VSKKKAIFDDRFKLEEKYGWEDEEGDLIDYLSKLSAEDVEKYFILERAQGALHILRAFEHMQEVQNDVSKLEAGFLGANMYMIGMWHASILEIDTLLEPSTLKKWHSLLARDTMKKGRWAVHNKPFEDAVGLADDLWSKGESRMHHEMVDYL